MQTGQKGERLTAAILFAVGAAALAASDAVIVRALDGAVHPFVIAFYRALFGAILLVPFLAVRPQVLSSTHSVGQHAIRAVFKLFAMVAFFAAFGMGPLADVTAIAFMSPIFVVLGAAFLLGERPGARMFAAALIGFAGAMVIVGPSPAGLSLAIFLALIGALLQAGIQLILKSMSKGDSTSTLVVWNLLLTVPISLVLAIPFFTMPGHRELMLLALQGVVGTSCMGLMTHAMSLAPASVVAPVDFLRLPLVALGGIAFFNETIALTTVVGALLICLAALIAARARGAKASN
ncbi:DMT family transporter [Peteryoungia ipomoeae]|uniref:DMT family transporter n=1 Tax=Peteryoungia ipomoeae TaxID=1210932 RepID=A0A4S8NUD9_9HYPH|nr:DMT family transporter [Peteryoungia ipomoeae]THV20958.1 DMT family transporter [Peteryoungia ipomoeae]